MVLLHLFARSDIAGVAAALCMKCSHRAPRVPRDCEHIAQWRRRTRHTLHTQTHNTHARATRTRITPGIVHATQLMRVALRWLCYVMCM